MSETSLLDRTNTWIRKSITIKLFFIGILILLLMIPSGMINSIISERQQTQRSAVQEVSSKWGNLQTIGGPVLTIPYSVYWKDDDGETHTKTEEAHFLPELLNVKGEVNPHIKKRSIFEVMLYNSELQLSGHFARPDFKALKIEEKNVKWEDAFITMGIPDLRGIKEEVTLSLSGQSYPFDPGLLTADHFRSGISSRIYMTPNFVSDAGAPFKIDLNINGSSQLSFIPVGKITDVEINSSWNHPSFNGNFLPTWEPVGEDEGFTASWKILHHNRNYPQQWTENKHSFVNSEFGVEFFMPVDHYQKGYRSSKYSIMFIGFTFLVYFFVEILNKKRIHPIQYLLVGFAICIFYLLLVSMSEHIPFITSYLIAATAIITLITLYTRTIVKNWRLSGIMAGLLIILYVFLYVLLLQQDFALLLGSLGLFITLAVVMYITRKIDWYGDEIEAPLDPIPTLE